MIRSQSGNAFNKQRDVATSSLQDLELLSHDFNKFKESSEGFLLSQFMSPLCVVDDIRNADYAVSLSDAAEEARALLVRVHASLEKEKRDALVSAASLRRDSAIQLLQQALHQPPEMSAPPDNILLYAASLTGYATELALAIEQLRRSQGTPLLLAYLSNVTFSVRPCD
jgi:hypothetical protein